MPEDMIPDGRAEASPKILLGQIVEELRVGRNNPWDQSKGEDAEDNKEPLRKVVEEIPDEVASAILPDRPLVVSDKKWDSMQLESAGAILLDLVDWRISLTLSSSEGGVEGWHSISPVGVSNSSSVGRAVYYYDFPEHFALKSASMPQQYKLTTYDSGLWVFSIKAKSGD